MKSLSFPVFEDSKNSKFGGKTAHLISLSQGFLNQAAEKQVEQQGWAHSALRELCPRTKNWWEARNASTV